MMSMWAHRPQLLHLGLFFAAYVLGCGFAQLFAIIPGTGISIWPPGGLMMATLVLASMRTWPWWVLAGCLAELLSNFLWFHSPLPAAVLIYVGNALEAMAGAWLVNRVCGRPVRLETLQEVLAFVVLGAGIAPVISATVGSATLAWFGIQSQSFATAWPLWWIGDATGILLVAPLALVMFQNWRGKAQLSAARWMEAGALGLILLGVAALSLGGYLPFAYIIMPPLLWAAVRFEFKGAAVALTLLALITAVFTISGASQFAGDPESQKHKQIMLQLFLAISAFSALIVAAISRQHQQALLTLRESERQLQQLVDVVPSHVWRLTPDGEPTFFNKRMVDFLGLQIADVDRPGMTPLEAIINTVIHPSEAAAFRGVLSRCLVTGESFAMRYRLRRVDGVYRWMSSRAEPLRDQDGRIVQWYGLCHDIEDQMHTEQALRRSERQLQQLIDTVPAIIWCTTPEGIPCYLNKRATEATGVTLKDLVAPDGSRSLSVIHPDDRDAVDQALAHSFATGASFMRRYRQRRSNGPHRWVESRAEPLRDDSGEILQWYGVSVDIHELVTAQEALRDRERELSQLVDMVPIPIWRLTPDGEPTFFNKRLIDFVGLDERDYEKPGQLAAAIQTLVHPDDAAGVAEALDRSFATGEPFSRKYRIRRADGVYRWMEGRGEPMRDQNGCIVQWYGLLNDIDDQLKAEEALRRSERQLQEMIDAVPVRIWSATPDGGVVYFNKRYQDHFRAVVTNFEGQEQPRFEQLVHELIYPDDSPEVMRTLSKCFETGTASVMRFRWREQDSAYRWAECRVEPRRDQHGSIVQWYGASIDIDDEVRAQAALRQASDKLAQAAQAASLAELSASIAHEVNQPLAAIVANSHACQRWLKSDPPNLERAQVTAERIIRDANSAADVVSRIRALFRQSIETRNSRTLRSVITEARKLIAEEAVRRRVNINVDVESNLPRVAFDRVQIQQVLINLIRNGMDAMESVAGDRDLGLRVLRTGDVIQTEISDHGPGIESPDKIFEPFFTTKEHGMGMGLAICRSIVESHGGRLWAEKNEPHGAKFIFTLPVEAKTA